MPTTAIAHHYADLGEVLIHYVTAGQGPPVVLLHGWPQTWWEWRHVIPALAQRYTVIAPDLRGLGDSSRPLTGYDKKTVADDIWRLVGEKLGHKSFFLVGHDWGGPTAYALAAAHPEAVRRLVILDVVIPGSGGDFSEGGRRWHHQFHMTPDLPEALTQGREDVYLAWFYRTFAYRPDAIGPDDLTEYLRTYVSPAPCGRASPSTAQCRRTRRQQGHDRPLQAADAGAGDGRRRQLPAWARTRQRAGAVVAAGGHRCAGRGGAGLRPLHSRGGA